MNIRRLFLSSVLAFCCIGLNAQNTPQSATIQVEEFEYKKPSAGKVALNVLSSLATDVIYTTDKTMAPQINEAIAAAASGIPWLGVLGGNDSAPDYILKGVITNAENDLGTKLTSCFIAVHATVVDAKTGKELHTKLVKGSDFAYITGNVSELKTGAAADLSRNIRKYIFEVLPVAGTVLEKGVEQANGKVKESQCYVDLGSMHGVLPDMPLYIVENGDYKGELKVKEVMGDDLSSCKISKGKSYIEKSLAKGKTVTVTSKPKKIKDM